MQNLTCQSNSKQSQQTQRVSSHSWVFSVVLGSSFFLSAFARALSRTIDPSMRGLTLGLASIAESMRVMDALNGDLSGAGELW